MSDLEGSMKLNIILHSLLTAVILSVAAKQGYAAQQQGSGF